MGSISSKIILMVWTKIYLNDLSTCDTLLLRIVFNEYIHKTIALKKE